MHLPPFLTEVEPNEIRLTGSRIGLIDVIHFFNEGESPERIVARFPTLRLAHVYDVIAFYLNNRPVVDECVRKNLEDLDQLRAAGHHFDLAKMRARMDALQQARQKPAEV